MEKQDSNVDRTLRLVHRESSSHLLLLTLLSFAASVAGTRLYLTLSGYPRIGSGEIHIAHVLFGGVLLFAGSLVPLMFANRWSFSLSAILAGVGVGLFIDEVGKFITTGNDYFFPAAAPIVYIAFLLTILLYILARRVTNSSPNADLHRAIGEIREMLEHPIPPGKHLRLRSRLSMIAQQTTAQSRAQLASSLLGFVDAEPPKARSARQRLIWRDMRRPRLVLSLLTRANYLRPFIVLGLLSLAFLTFKNPANLILRPYLPPEASRLLGEVVGRHFDPAAAPSWADARVSLEAAIGFVLLASAVLLSTHADVLGSKLALVVLLIYIVLLNPMLYYFEQFSTIVTTAMQFLLVICLVRYQRRLTTRWSRPGQPGA